MKKLVLVAIAAAMIFTAGRLIAQEKPAQEKPTTVVAAGPLERYLPSKVMMFVKLREASALPEYFKTSPVFKIWEEKDIQSAVKEQYEQIKKQVEEGIKGFEEASELKVKEILEVFQGEVAFCLIDLDVKAMEETGEPKIDLVFSVDAGDKKDQLAKIIETGQKMILKEAGPGGPQASVSDYKGHKIHSLGDDEVKFNATWLGTKWVLAMDIATLRGMIDRYKAQGVPADSLEASKDFSIVHKKCGNGKEEIFLYYDMSSLMTSLKDTMPPQIAKLWADTGMFDSAVYGYGALLEADGTSRELSFVLLPKEHKIQKLVGNSKINTTLYLPPENIILWLSGSNDWSETFNYMMNFLSTPMREQGMDLAESLKEVEEVLGFKLEEELIKALKPTYNIYVMLPQGGGAFPELALTFDIEKSDLIGTAIEKFAKKMGGEKLRSTDYQGYKIYYISIDEFIGEKTDVPYWPSFTYAKNTLLIASSPQVLKRMIGNLEKPVAPTGNIKAALDKTPKEAMQFAYVDMKKGFSYVYNTVIPYINKQYKDEIPFEFDAAKLPPVEVFTKHLSYMYTFSTKDEKGMYGEIISPAGPLTMPMLGGAIVAAAAIPMFMMGPGGMPPGPMGPMGPGLQGASEAATISALRTLSSAQELYNMRFGTYAGNLQMLAEKNMISQQLATGVRSGYIIDMQADGANGWNVTARPLVPGKDKRYFYIDETGVIRSSEKPDIGPESTPLGG
jgi:hypothetical protein